MPATRAGGVLPAAHRRGSTPPLSAPHRFAPCCNTSIFARSHLFAAQRQFGMAALLHSAGEHFGLALATNAVWQEWAD